MTSAATAMFWGDGEHEGENPQDFINGLELSFMQKTTPFTPGEMVKVFSLKLKAGSMAKEWFMGLQNTEKDTWVHLQTAFEARWPEKVTTAKTRDEKAAALDQTRLEVGRLGIREKVDGVEEFSHIVWADKVERLANAIPDPSGLLIVPTRHNLPRVLKKLVGSKHITWTAFCNAIRGISGTELIEAMEDDALTATKEDLRHAQLSAPLKALTRSMQSVSLSPVPAQPNLQHGRLTPVPQATRPVTSGQGRTPFRPDTDRLVDVLRLALPIPPATPAGIITYTAQITAWNTSNHGRAPNELRPYPLSPGSCPVASGECWLCGFTGHMRQDCTGTKVPDPEFKWRSIAATIKTRAEAAATPVNLVDTEDEEGGWVAQSEYDVFMAWKLLGQGNGSGPSV